MRSITTSWYDVNDVMPPRDGEYYIVRAINKDSQSFYFMAYFEYDANKWIYFDENLDHEEKNLNVTHWCDNKEELFCPYRNVQKGTELL